MPADELLFSTSRMMVVFALSVSAEVLGSFPIAVALIFVVGVSMTVFNMSVMTTLQLLVPDVLRGRVMGFWAMTWNIMPVGGIFLGVVAEGLGAPAAVSIGAVIVLVLVALPAFLRPSIRGLETGSAGQVAATVDHSGG